MSNSDNSSSNTGSSLPLSDGLQCTTVRPERTSKIDWPSDAISEGEPAWYCGDTYPPIAFICGPMSGLPGFNQHAFHRITATLRAAGWRVENPAENFGGRTDLDYAQYIRAATIQLLNCNTLVALDGWEASGGASGEYRLAERMGLKVMAEAEALAMVS